MFVAIAVLCVGLSDGFGARTAPRRGAMTMRARKLGLGKKAPKKQKVLTKVPGITAPGEKTLKGWALEVSGSESVRLTAGTCNGRLYVLEAECSRCGWDQGRKRVIQRRFNVGVPRARVQETTFTLRDRSER